MRGNFVHQEAFEQSKANRATSPLEKPEKRKQTGCKYCSRNQNWPAVHDGWFEMNALEAGTVTGDQKVLATEKLCTNSRVLLADWVKVVQYRPEQTARGLFGLR